MSEISKTLVVWISSWRKNDYLTISSIKKLEMTQQKNDRIYIKSLVPST
jgi:hypothetical protein